MHFLDIASVTNTVIMVKESLIHLSLVQFCVYQTFCIFWLSKLFGVYIIDEASVTEMWIEFM